MDRPRQWLDIPKKRRFFWCLDDSFKLLKRAIFHIIPSTIHFCWAHQPLLGSLAGPLPTSQLCNDGFGLQTLNFASGNWSVWKFRFWDSLKIHTGYTMEFLRYIEVCCGMSIECSKLWPRFAQWTESLLSGKKKKKQNKTEQNNAGWPVLLIHADFCWFNRMHQFRAETWVETCNIPCYIPFAKVFHRLTSQWEPPFLGRALADSQHHTLYSTSWDSTLTVKRAINVENTNIACSAVLGGWNRTVSVSEDTIFCCCFCPVFSGSCWTLILHGRHPLGILGDPLAIDDVTIDTNYPSKLTNTCWTCKTSVSRSDQFQLLSWYFLGIDIFQPYFQLDSCRPTADPKGAL